MKDGQGKGEREERGMETEKPEESKTHTTPPGRVQPMTSQPDADGEF